MVLRQYCYCGLSTLSHSRLNEKGLFLGLKLRDIIFATVVMSAPPLDVRDGLNVSQSYFWSRGFISFTVRTSHSAPGAALRCDKNAAENVIL